MVTMSPRGSLWMALETVTMRNMIGLMVVAAMTGTGCSTSTPNTLVDNSVAAQVARSVPTGAAASASPMSAQAITDAQGLNNNSSVASILNGLAAMNQVATQKTNQPGVPSSLTVGDLITAFNKGLQQPNATTSALNTSHQKIGFTQGVVGPGPLFPPTMNGQNLQAQRVPALTTPY